MPHKKPIDPIDLSDEEVCSLIIHHDSKLSDLHSNFITILSFYCHTSTVLLIDEINNQQVGYERGAVTKTFEKDELGVPPIQSIGFEAKPRNWRYPPEKSSFRSRRRFFYREEFIDFPNYMDWAYRLVRTICGVLMYYY